MKRVIFFIALLIAGCDEFAFAPEIFVTYVVGNRDPQNRAIIVRLFSADGGYVTSSPPPYMPAGSTWQEQREMATIDNYNYSNRRDVTVQVVWTISIITPSGRDSLVASADMQLVHGRTAQIMWVGKLNLKGQNVPLVPADDVIAPILVEICDRDRSIIHDQLEALLRQ